MDQREGRASRGPADSRIEAIRRNPDFLRITGDRPVLPEMQFDRMQEALDDRARQAAR